MESKARQPDDAAVGRVARELMTDSELAARIQGGELGLFELVMRRYNQRLFRIARSILRDDGEAEEAVQETYIRAYQHLDELRGPQGFGSWLCRIVTTQALMRIRRADWAAPRLSADEVGGAAERELAMGTRAPSSPTPEDSAYREQLLGLLEQAIDALPDPYRVAFVMREVEQMSVRETAACLNIEAATVKTRVHRARRLLRQTLSARVQAATSEAFGFAGSRCDRIVARVLARLAAEPAQADSVDRFH